ncbi:MAG TPA: molybdopterin molybdenumtransferase MoeA [Chromatiaceae bacterium]|nr:molybdopterin molybdenumtransferase MoeA [Chromatiaceae bacterium]
MQTYTICTTPSCADDREPGILTVDQARQRILTSLSSLQGEERLALRSALGRVLSKDLVSPLNVPGHDNSAMDGYALAGDQLREGAFLDLQVIATVAAGDRFEGYCGPGECVRIMTGAPMPAGTDTVVMQEQVMELENGRVRIASGHPKGQNVRSAGEDIAAGSKVLETGHRLRPADLGVLASIGIAEVSVKRRVRVAFFSTGNELRGIGEPLSEGDLYDSNRYSLHGMLKRLDMDMFDLGVVPDDPAALREAFASAASLADVVITSGGVSVGEADYTKPILEEMGEMNFWKIAMKPGRPLAFGRLGDALFFGLPGNPVAVMVTFYQFVLPALEKLASGRAWKPFLVKATCTSAIRKRPGRYEFVRGLLQGKPDGTFTVEGLGQQGSGILTSMSRGNCFILLDEERGDVAAGEHVLTQPFEALV